MLNAKSLKLLLAIKEIGTKRHHEVLSFTDFKDVIHAKILF